MDALDKPQAQDLSQLEVKQAEVASGALALSAAGHQHRTLWRDAFHRLIQNKLALAGAIVILIIVGMAVFASIVAPEPYAQPDFAAINEFPSAAHWLGTDELGRDFLSRLIYGAQVSMLVGLGAQFIVLVIGVPIGSIAGYAGGKVDTALMRFVDVMYAFPSLLFVILIMAWRGPGLTNIFLAIGFTAWVTLARLTRAEFLSLREKDFVQAARAAGAGPWRLITRHLLPNALTPIIVAITFGIPQAIFTEAGLSFIGVGVPPPRPSWGQMVGQYFANVQSYWFLAVLPAVMIALVMLSFTFFGDGLRDALDPRMQRR
ncbi:MAG TPA: ABC transporter permease [Thermomicrobiaceae bacterium]|nr:ABC transporter permease [Thermomicrobiaceae bacterium]